MDVGDIKVGAWLKPGARYLFQRYEPHELRNKVVVGRDMTMDISKELEECINNNHNVQQNLESLEDFIEEMIRRNLIKRHKMVDHFIDNERSTHSRSVLSAIQDLPVSYRQFSRLIKHYTGFTAKDFLQLQRLRAATQTIDNSKQSLAIIAAEHQYADHAHLAREFKLKIGISPSGFDSYQSL
jgi:AraC-like DNA-binding protein